MTAETVTEDEDSSEAVERTGLLDERVRLVVLSFLMLFLELALIRWSGSNVVYLSYFSNFVLLGSFLGIGLGFLRASRRINLFPWTPFALAAVVGFITVFPVQITTSANELIFFGAVRTNGPPIALVLTAIFIVVAAVMAFVGEGVARTFQKFEPLEAYKWDLIGSVGGILGVMALSFLRAPPLAWGGVVAVVLIVLYLPITDSRFALVQVAAMVGVLVMLGIETFQPDTYWSPYYKVETEAIPEPDGEVADDPRLSIDVNGVPHQAQLAASDNPIYNLVYQRAIPPSLDDVLIIGAGSGNDVAVALARGAKHIDAVEIDPQLYELGRDHHPDRPYDDPRVDIHINDGRAFLERTDQKYDLILFGLPDSITLVQGQSSLRLESYLFTREAIEASRSRLKPGGVFSMYNYYRENWLLDRYATTLDEAFGREPCVSSLGPPEAGRLAILVDSVSASSLNCPPDEQWSGVGVDIAPATDDFPFPYLRSPGLPSFYVVTILAIFLVSVLAVRTVGGPIKPMLRYTDLFFMGAAFLLLTTKNVVQFALLFGTTWFVNALVFLGVLLSVLVAVAVSRRVTFRHPARLYIVLIAALALAWIVPPSALLELAYLPRFLAAMTLAFFPIFTANLVFTQRFKGTSHSTIAFGANLIGAMFGGVVEYAALITGYRFLLVLVALLYGAAFLFGRKHLVGSGGGASPLPVGAASAP